MQGEGVHVIDDGALAIEDSRIIAVGKSNEVERDFSGDIVIDATRKAVLPGLIDAHIHTSLSLLRGVAQDVAETEWMHKTIDPFKKHYTNEAEIIGSKLCVIEGLKAGTTCFGDYGSGMANLAQDVYQPVGVRANLCSTINELSAERRREASELYHFDNDVGQNKLQENLDLIRQWHNGADGRITCHFGPQGADMMSKDLLLHVKELAQEYNLPIHMHVAQSLGREHKQMLKRYGKSTVRFLEEINYLDSQLIAAHCHGTTPEELQILARSGTNMVGCPGSIGMIDGIVPPLYSYLEAGGTAALGSDQSPPDGNRIFDQMKYAAILSKVKHQDPTVLPAWKVLRMVTIEAARVLGLDAQIGSIEIGKKADIVLLDLNRPHLTPILKIPIRNLIPNLVFQATGNEFTTSIINGKIIMENRQITTINEEQIIQKAQKVAEELAEKAETDFNNANSGLVSMMREGKL